MGMDAVAYAHGLAFPDELSRRIAIDLVQKKRGMFESHADWQTSDLVDECVKEALSDWPRYNPSKSKPQTFIYQSCWGTLLDLSRKLSRRPAHRRMVDDSVGGTVEAEDPEELANWLGQTHRALKSFFVMGGVSLRIKGAWDGWPDKSQRAALVLLQKRLGYSDRQMEELVASKREIRLAIGIDYAPHNTFYTRMRSPLYAAKLGGIAAKFESLFAGKKRHQEVA